MGAPMLPKPMNPIFMCLSLRSRILMLDENLSPRDITGTGSRHSRRINVTNVRFGALLRQAVSKAAHFSPPEGRHSCIDHPYSQNWGYGFFIARALNRERCFYLTEVVQIVPGHQARHVGDALVAALLMDAVVVPEFLRNRLQ